MKKVFLILIAIIFTSYTSSAQEKSKSKFSIIGYGEIGYANVQNDNEPNYNMNIEAGGLLVNYNLNTNFGIATGVGFTQLTGNGFNTFGDFYHERNLLKIPLLLTIYPRINDNMEFFGNLGFYTQTIVKDDYRYLLKSTENLYEGWNFGTQVGVGFLFDVVTDFKMGITFNAQADLSTFNSNNTAIVGQQKMKTMNTVGFILKYDL